MGWYFRFLVGFAHGYFKVGHCAIWEGVGLGG